MPICKFTSNAHSWVTLLSPTNISVLTSMVGNELDLGSPSLNQLMVDNIGRSHGRQSRTLSQNIPLHLLTLIPTAFNFSFSPVFEPVIDMFALASAGRSFGIPSTVNFNGISYNASTGGILPIVLNKAEIHGYNTTSSSYGSSWQGGITPSRTRVQGRYPQPSGSSSIYTLTQQGFTADVSCRAHNLSIVPSVAIHTEVVNTSSSMRLDLKAWEWLTKCATYSTECEFGPLHSSLDRLMICVSSDDQRHVFV